MLSQYATIARNDPGKQQAPGVLLDNKVAIKS